MRVNEVLEDIGSGFLSPAHLNLVVVRQAKAGSSWLNALSPPMPHQSGRLAVVRNQHCVKDSLK